MWVRENCRAEELSDGLDGVRYLADNAFVPIENTAEAAERWGMLHAYDFKRRGYCATVPAIHMPRWASRITLEITEARVERVQDISNADAYAEGIDLAGNMSFPVRWYRDRWNALNAKQGFGWNANPWVWLITFRLIKPPED
jgi:hypothetical protein